MRVRDSRSHWIIYLFLIALLGLSVFTMPGEGWGTQTLAPGHGSGGEGPAGQWVVKASANIPTAIEFLRRWGMTAEADNVELWFKKGRILLDVELTDPETGALTGWITLDAKAALGGGPNSSNRWRRFDPANPEDFEAIAELAFTLVHEKVHAHQSALYIGHSETSAEADAYRREVERADRTIVKMLRELTDAMAGNKLERVEQLLRWIKAVIVSKTKGINAFISQYTGFIPAQFPYTSIDSVRLQALKKWCDVELRDLRARKEKITRRAREADRQYKMLHEADKNIEPAIKDADRQSRESNRPRPFDQAGLVVGVIDRGDGVTQIRLLTDDGRTVSVFVDAGKEKVEQAGCRTGGRVRIKGGEEAPNRVKATLSAIRPEQGKGDAGHLLDDVVRSGEVAIQLKGDGRSTAKVQLLLTNRAATLLRVVVQRHQFFSPATVGFQVMMAAQDVVVTLAPGQTTSVDLPTVCVSPKSIKPPPPAGVTYHLGSDQPQELQQLLSRVLEMAGDLELDKFYQRVPIPKERREHTIAQLAIWMELGQRSNNPQDAITPEGIKEELVKQTGIQPETLPPDQKEVLEKGVQTIFAAADLTLKASQSTR